MNRRWLIFFPASWFFLVGCLWWVGWERPLSEATPGSCPSFDNALCTAGTGRRFLFDQENRVVATCLPEGNDEVVLDLFTLTGTATAKSSDVLVSPGGRRLLISVMVNGYVSSPKEKRFFLHDIPARQTTEIRAPAMPAVPSDASRGFYEWGHVPVHWLGPDAFLMTLVWYPPEGAHLYKHRLLRYQLVVHHYCSDG